MVYEWIYNQLAICYSGHRIASVLDDAAPVTQNGSMDYPGGNREMKFGYNAWGALVKDGSRGITGISYDRFGNPLKISYSDGSCTENVYSASGEKLKTIHSTAIPGSTVTAKSTIEYRGNVIYRDGKVYMVLFPGGYATVNGTAVTFHYYTQDYLGNNRAVINGSTGAIEQTTAYYPFGAVIADHGTPTTGQPYKFGGKELMTANGLNEYDFGARQYYPAVPFFTRIDPLCEKYYWLSPYHYCANNPVNAIDPDGRDVFVWATTLPDAPKVLTPATHTFITVTKSNGITAYFAYGSEFDGAKGAFGGRLCRREYNQDKRIFSGANTDSELLKAKILVDVPKGMTQDEFDQKVIDVAESFGDVEGIGYSLTPMEPTKGNCNSSTSTILYKSGVSKDKLKEIDDKIPMIDIGFGSVKPWTKEEQENAIQDKNNRYETLEKAMP